ncbi:hypothetical protein NDU88_001795 [Pleurodeles waltl]|uniref:Uncharacterized protein n=1 Tax=Pleurodeles waltl TaxID=8319 RepID=A0AAV7MTR5_PLEWA|nr:hypothetical protein NDU88_001795 [Pleurodeles waltl]
MDRFSAPHTSLLCSGGPALSHLAASQPCAEHPDRARLTLVKLPSSRRFCLRKVQRNRVTGRARLPATQTNTNKKWKGGFYLEKHQRGGTFVCNEHHCYYVPIRPYFRNTVLLVSSALYLVVCWIPYTTTSFFDIFQEEVVPSLVEKISTWLILLTSVLNPWLTSLGQKKYRKAMQETWKKFKQASAHLEANPTPSTRETGLSLRSRLSLPGSTSQTAAHT